MKKIKNKFDVGGSVDASNIIMGSNNGVLSGLFGFNNRLNSFKEQGLNQVKNLGEISSTEDLMNSWNSLVSVNNNDRNYTGNILTATGTGAATGASIGTAVGPIGTVLGGVIGGIAGLGTGLTQAALDPVRERKLNSTTDYINSVGVKYRNNAVDNYNTLSNWNNLATYAAEGGKIHIKAGNKGKFTEAASKAGMGVQEFARHILANKDNYSSTQIKRANFAKNAASWKHSDGGPLKKGKYEDWYKTVPADRNDTTSYNLKRAYELAPYSELEAWRTSSIKDLEEGKNHLRSVYINPNTGVYEFMKSKNHPSLHFETDWYNSNDPEAVKFKKDYDLDMSEDYYKYVPKKKAFGGDLLTHGAVWDNGLTYIGNGGTHEAASKAGMRVQEFARHILANKDNYSSTQIKRANFAKNAAGWKHSDGGQLNDIGLNYFATGGSHEQNPYGGVQQGIDEKGIPNLVEQGEYKDYNDYIYSRRYPLDKSFIMDQKLPIKFADKTPAEIVDLLTDEHKERPNDSISKRTLDKQLTKLRAAQDKSNDSFKRMINTNTNSYAGGSGLNLLGINYNYDNYLTNLNNELSNNQSLYDNGKISTNKYNRTKNRLNNTIQKWNTTKDSEITSLQNYLPNLLNNINMYKNRIPKINWNSNTTLGKMTNLYTTYNDRLTSLLGSDSGKEVVNNVINTQKEPVINTNSIPQVIGAGNTSITQKSDSKTSKETDNYNTKNSNNLSGLVDISKPWSHFSVDQYGNIDGTISINPTPIYTLQRSLSSNDIKDNIGKQKYIPNPNINNSDSSNIGTAVRYAPVVGSALSVLGDVFGKNKPDYANADLIAKNTKMVSYKPLGNYMTYTPMDTRYAQNQILAQAAGAQEGLKQVSAGNRGQYMAGILGLNQNVGNQLGNLERQSQEYNLNNKYKVEEFNRGINQFNSQQGLAASSQNANTLLNSAVRQAVLRDQIDSTSSAAISNNYNNLLTNLGSLGKENTSLEMIKNSPNLYFYVGADGKIHYKG